MSAKPFVLRRPFTSLLLLLLVILLAWVWHYRVHLSAFPSIFAAYTAKEYCSCRYVMNQPEAYCRTYAALPIPIADLTDDPDNKQVSARKFGNTQHAAWISPREGCRLQP